MTFIQGLCLLLCLSTNLRLLFYQRNGSHYKWQYSLLAYLLMLFSDFMMLLLLKESYQLHPLLLLAIVWLAVGVFACRGNVAQMVQLTTRSLV